ncbi:hypothetical protein G6F60_015502 [Rhizopus arrhizus]|nr:hypothetical protein G6F60_015502 [Rhizopus arrhizus]
MGEPLLNYDQVLPALRLMLDDNAYGLSRRRVTVSTSGVVPMMDRLSQDSGAAEQEVPAERVAGGLRTLSGVCPARLHHV